MRRLVSRACAPALLALLLVLTGCGPGTPGDVGITEAAGSSAGSGSDSDSDETDSPGKTGSPSPRPTKDVTSSSPSPTVSAAPEPTAGEGDAADAVPASLQWQALTVDGATFDAAHLAGKPTVLWFWAPWCPTCRGQIPMVSELASDYAGEVNVIGVGSLDAEDAIVEFAAEVPGATHLLDEAGEVWKRYGVVEQSSFVLLDEDGEVTFSAGYGGSEDLVDQVTDLLG